MKCVADENVDFPIVSALRDSGHDVWYVAEEAVGILDEEVLRKAAIEDALLLTGDKDFESVRYQGIPVISASVFAKEFLQPR